MIIVISTSLNPDSRSRILAQQAHKSLQTGSIDCEWIDLQELPLPFCDGGPCYSDANVQSISQKIEAADGVLIASPVYNYDVSASAKNLVELTGQAWRDKVVGFLLAAGGMGSYMSGMGLANSLMLDFRALVLPRFVYCTEAAIRNDQVADVEVRERIEELAQRIDFVATRLS